MGNELRWISGFEGAGLPDVPFKSLDWFGPMPLEPLDLADAFGGRQAAIDWWNAEVEADEEEGCPRSFARLERRWLEDPDLADPLIVIRDRAGKVLGLWDGWHRAALSILHNKPMLGYVGQEAEK
jgi:hypothetical protein